MQLQRRSGRNDVSKLVASGPVCGSPSGCWTRHRKVDPARPWMDNKIDRIGCHASLATTALYSLAKINRLFPRARSILRVLRRLKLRLVTLRGSFSKLTDSSLVGAPYARSVPDAIHLYIYSCVSLDRFVLRDRSRLIILKHRADLPTCNVTKQLILSLPYRILQWKYCNCIAI